MKKCTHCICVDNKKKLVCINCRKRFSYIEAKKTLKGQSSDWKKYWLKIEQNIKDLEEEKQRKKANLHGIIIIYKP